MATAIKKDTDGEAVEAISGGHPVAKAIKAEGAGVQSREDRRGEGYG